MGDMDLDSTIAEELVLKFRVTHTNYLLLSVPRWLKARSLARGRRCAVGVGAATPKAQCPPPLKPYNQTLRFGVAEGSFAES